jgi:hypothetical protein
MIRTVRLRERVRHNTRDNIKTACAYNGQIYVRPMVAIRKHKADLDMREQMRDLGSERDWYALNTVGVHRPWPGAMALWECELLGHDTPGCCRDGSDVYATSTSAGYEVVIDGYFVERHECGIRVIEPVIEHERVLTTWERKRADEEARKAARKERKRQQSLAARKRTLTDEQRKEILRRESVGARGWSRI